MKRIKYLFAFISALAVVIGSLMLCACKDEGGFNSAESEYYLNHSQTYSLEEAYELGLLTQEDIMHVAYYESGKVYRLPAGVEKLTDDTELEEVDFTPKQARPQLSSQIEKKIKCSYYYHNIEAFKDSDGSLRQGKDSLKVYYFGCYNGCYVAVVDSDLWAYPAVIDRLCVGGIVWTQPYPYHIGAFIFED